ncbi:MAG: hypothetical protein ACYC7E_11685 [Armatimonadota bacterium]
MSTEDPNDAKRVEQEFRIIDLKRQAQELAGGHMIEGQMSGDCPPELEEFFWEQVVAFESAPDTTHRAQLQQDGLQLPPPDDLSDVEIAELLTKIIETLASRRTYLESTDHLSDRELYTRLWADLLDNWTPDFLGDMPMPMNCHIDLIGSGDDEDTFLWLKYYADEDTRRRWVEQFPDYEVPPHEAPPYDRDRHLPKANYSVEEANGLPPGIEN